MQPKNNIAIRKRTQIAKANKMMFIWVAVASVLVGAASVISIFLAQMLIFNEKVLKEKEQTISVLDINNKNVVPLEENIRALDANQDLINAKAKPGDQAIQVILDALPSDSNPLALGASLQTKLLSGINGLTLNSLQVDSTGDSILSGQNEINFTFSVSGNETALKQVLVSLESSIRTIDIISLRIENQGNSRVMNVKAKAFYEPALVVGLKDKVVKQ